jgi:hypothetical protein
VVVGCVGGGAIIVAIAAYYYLYVVKPNAQLPPKTRDMENAPVVAPAFPIVAPAASLGYRPPPTLHRFLLILGCCFVNHGNETAKCLILQGSCSRYLGCAIQSDL